MENRRIVRRFGAPAKPVVQEADPEDEPQETQEDEPEEEEKQPPVVRRRVLSQPTVAATPAKAVTRTSVAPPPAARVVTAIKKAPVVDDDDMEEDPKPVAKVGKKVVPALAPVVDGDDEPDPLTRPVKRAVPVMLPTIEDHPEDDSEPEEPDTSKHTVHAKPQPFPEPALEKFRIRSVNETVAGDVFSQMFQAMASGASIIVTRLDDGKWQFTSTNIQADVVAKASSGKLSGKAYWDEVTSPDFVKFHQDWDNLTYDERKRRAKKAGAIWNEDKSQKIDAMRMTEAYTEKLGIKKYKPEYENKAARAAIKG
jgi:hypothetical protein